MKQHIVTTAIVLARTNFGEADRILTVITPDHGKRRLMAKGVRKERSKLAGGIELFSVSSISYIEGRSEIDTLVSSRLIKHYGHIVNDVNRTMLGYELLKRLNRATEDGSSEEYFQLIEQALVALDDDALSYELTDLWFNAQLLKLGGHHPNLKTDANNKELKDGESYSFEGESMAFLAKTNALFTARHIKLLRLVFNASDPLPLKNVQNIEKIIPATQNLVSSMLTEHVRI